MTTVQFRSTTVADAPAVARFLQETLAISPGHPVIEPANLCWKYWDERREWPGSRSYVLTSGDEIMAHAAVMPGDWSVRDRTLKVLHVIDWAAKKGFGGSGVALMKRLGQMSGAMVAVDGSEETMKLLPVIGFKAHGSVTWYARPLRPLIRLRAARQVTWRLPAQFLRSVFWSASAPLGSRSSWTAERVGLQELSSASIKWPVSAFGMIASQRTPELMGYLLRCPVCPMRLFSVSRNGRTRGYFVLTYAPAQARLADCWIDSGEAGDWNDVVRLAVSEATRDANVAEIVSMCSDPLLDSALRSSGFHVRGQRPLLLRLTGGATVPTEVVRFQMLDNDASFRHDGRSEFWA